jgi:HAD superfamily hydrolase (TIGR01509 family)
MSWKAIIFDFNGVIINDESIHKKLIDEILLGENLLPCDQDYNDLCLGRSDRLCLRQILAKRGRFVTQEYLNKLIQKKATAYREIISTLESLPLYSDVTDFLAKIKEHSLLIALVTGASRSDVELVLNSAGIADYFTVIVTGDDITTSKPDPDGYLLALSLLEKQHPHLLLKPSDCLVIEDTFAGIQAAKSAGMQVVGVANTYPLHLLQRQTNWVIDHLSDLELDRVEQVLALA